MLTPFQRDVQDSTDEAVRSTTASVSSSSSGGDNDGDNADIWSILQGSADAQCIEAGMSCYAASPFSTIFSRSVSPTCQRAVSREVDELYGTWTLSHTMASVPVPSNDAAPVAEGQSPDAEPDDVTRAPGATQLPEAHPRIAMNIPHSCLTTAPCGWAGEGNAGTCDTRINCTNVSTHFKDSHGIKNMGENTLICCRWRGCGKWGTRKNFVRHIRERHLEHPRGKKHP